MASEPAEPTARQDPELWRSPTIGVWRHTPRGPMLTPGFEMVNDPDGEHFREELPDDAMRLVLADPAQTTELEPDRLREELLQGVIDQDGERIKQLENEVARLRKAVQRPPHAAQVEAEERALTSARRADDTSLLLRGMARKLVAYRKWTLGDDVPAVHRLAEAREGGKKVLALAEKFQAERDERQARLGAALAKLNASDKAASWEAMYDLVVEAKTILRGWASAEPAGEAVPVEELRRAALAGDQPTTDGTP